MEREEFVKRLKALIVKHGVMMKINYGEKSMNIIVIKNNVWIVTRSVFYTALYSEERVQAVINNILEETARACAIMDGFEIDTGDIDEITYTIASLQKMFKRNSGVKVKMRLEITGEKDNESNIYKKKEKKGAVTQAIKHKIVKWFSEDRGEDKCIGRD